MALATAVLARQDRPTVVEINLFRLINELPSAVRPPLLGIMQLGALGAVPALAAVALLRNRSRLARQLVVGGTAAWLVAKLLQTIVDQEPPEIVLPNVLLHGATQAGFSFPSTHVAVAAAMATVAGPYLSRPNRRLAWWVWPSSVLPACTSARTSPSMLLAVLPSDARSVHSCNSVWARPTGCPMRRT